MDARAEEAEGNNGGWRVGEAEAHFGLPGGVAHSLETTEAEEGKSGGWLMGEQTGMLVARALPFSPKCFRATLASISTGS